ncbi:MAG: hypothetical protein HQL36_05765 [Alphaproteobacteria bacterium]|nr:hypothetical protein [Alphaproteobacteria bacterium]
MPSFSSQTEDAGSPYKLLTPGKPKNPAPKSLGDLMGGLEPQKPQARPQPSVADQALKQLQSLPKPKPAPQVNPTMQNAMQQVAAQKRQGMMAPAQTFTPTPEMAAEHRRMAEASAKTSNHVPMRKLLQQTIDDGDANSAAEVRAFLGTANEHRKGLGDEIGKGLDSSKAQLGPNARNLLDTAQASTGRTGQAQPQPSRNEGRGGPVNMDLGIGTLKPPSLIGEVVQVADNGQDAFRHLAERNGAGNAQISSAPQGAKLSGGTDNGDGHANPGQNLQKGENSQGIEKPDRFNDFIEKMYGREGGYVNDPNDYGGPTNFGITKNALEAYQEKHGGLGKGGEAVRVENLTREQAKVIYKTSYYDFYRIGEIKDDGLAQQAFDLHVNSRPETAGRILQKSINEVHPDAQLHVDGKMGSKTIEALNRATPEQQRKIFQKIDQNRAQFYEQRGQVDETQRKFLKGWHNRRDTIR